MQVYSFTILHYKYAVGSEKRVGVRLRAFRPVPRCELRRTGRAARARARRARAGAGRAETGGGAARCARSTGDEQAMR
jgi:hypothetical protein